MNKLFSFDVTLKDLMNLGERAKEFPKLQIIFEFLEHYWYDLKDIKSEPKTIFEQEKQRWNYVRVGSIDVYLDDQNQLCFEFKTRFQFSGNPTILEFFEKIKSLEYPDILK